MKITLAGYNIDYEQIMDIEDALPDLDVLTPETIAAAYARISRSPKAVDELRAMARAEVDKARASNENIVFTMGHSSIAEHAVFNIDVIGVSRLIVEEIEHFRLCSFTEKSQRYVLLQDDYVVPEEITTAGLREAFRDLINGQYDFYRRCYESLRTYVFALHPDLAVDPKNRSLLEGWAKEDARYILSLATETQLGMTINARNLALMIRRLDAHPLQEAREVGRALLKVTKPVAPSLIRYTEATAYDRLTRRELCQKAAALIGNGGENPPGNGGDVRLLYATPQADLHLVACLLHSSSRRSFATCREAAAALDQAARRDLVLTALRRLQAHDAVLREFEHVEMLFELTVSASCFAQLKRHRMATLTVQDYDPALGFTVPPAVAAVGLEDAFGAIMARTAELYERVREAVPAAAPYCLTNAHRRRVLFKVNARQMYHVSRLRADAHAQWDIRSIATQMMALARQIMPLTMALATGKDDFTNLYERVFAGTET
ncbi:MAG: FAD-dependent thymidylate synthase [Syntrophales bacterium]|nr:FAD-dependent thymidylate synthase [Syntrophales bacterium]